MKSYLNSIVSLLIHFCLVVVFFFGGKSFASKTDFLLAQANHNINVEHDNETSKRFNEWENLLFHNLGKSTTEKLKLVNDFFNKMKWSDDKEIWNKKDYWATPIESLVKNSGDCEDFCNGKIFTISRIFD